MMTKDRVNGTSISRLLNADGRTIGWVILWDNSELSALWLGDDTHPTGIDPPLEAQTLQVAKSVTTDALTDLFESLSAKKASNPRE